MRRSEIFLTAALFIVGSFLVVKAFAEPVMLASQTAENVTRPCSFKDVVKKTLNSTTNGAAGSFDTINSGQIVVTCGNKACLGHSATAAGAIAASEKANCNAIPKDLPYPIIAEARDFFAVSAASGETASTCTFASCR